MFFFPFQMNFFLRLQIDIPKTSPIVESFTCSKAVSNAYRLSLVRLCNRALSTAQKVSLQVDDRGFLCFQFMLRSEEGKPCIVDFFVSSPPSFVSSSLIPHCTVSFWFPSSVAPRKKMKTTSRGDLPVMCL